MEIDATTCLLDTEDPHHTGRLADFVGLVFTALNHTPITKVELMYTGEWAADDQDEFDAVLGGFVPGPAALASQIISRSGTVELPGISGPPATTRVTLESSDMSQHGMWVNVVDELRAFRSESSTQAEATVALVDAHWPRFLELAPELTVTVVGGHRATSPELAEQANDRQTVWDRLIIDLDREAASDWLYSPNRLLNGALPSVWLHDHGPDQVLMAFEVDSRL